MKQKLRFLMLTLLCAVFSTAWGDTETIDFSTLGYSNQQEITTVNGTNFSVYFNKGTNSNTPKYFTNGTAIRVYGGGYFTVTSHNTISQIIISFGSDDGSNAITTDVGNYESGTWTGSSTSVKFMVGGTSGNRRIKAIAITFDGQPTDKYYVAGSWTNPTWEDGKIQMTKNSDGKYILSNQLLPKYALFKIIKVPSSGTNSVWCGGSAEGDNYWVTVDNHTDIPLKVDGGKDFYMPIAGIWTFIVDPTGDTPKLTVEGNWPKWEYYLVGDFNDWSTTSIDSYKFGQVGETSNFTLNKPIKYGEKFKIYGIRGEEEKWFGAISDGDFWVNAEHVDTELSLTTENGGENFYMNLSNKNDYWTLDFDLDNKKLVLSNFVSDVAELPFEFDGGRNAITNTPGLKSSALESDYANTTAKLKFTSSGQELILHFNERPGELSFDIKSNGFSGGTFEVQTSEDGENYTTKKSYTSISGATNGQSETINNLGENVRYIKWVYTTKATGNVGLGNIKLEKAPQPYIVTITQVENAEIKVFYNNAEIESGAEVLSSSEVKVSATASEGYQIGSVIVTDGDGQAVTTTKVEGQNDTWTFTMPKSNVTVTCTANEIPENDEEWVKTDLADLTEDDIFVIVGFVNNAPYAMANFENNDNLLDAVSGLLISNDRITQGITDEIKWNISSNTDGYTFYPNGSKDKWLYITNTPKGVRVGTNTNNKLILKDDYLYNESTQRYIGIYNKANWRCYTLSNGAFPSNIAGQTFGFYKLVKKFTFTINEAAFDGETYYATIADLGAGYYKVGDDFEVSTVAVVNGKLEIAPFETGAIIPGKAAYLVRSATAGIHKLSPVYPLPSGFTPIDVNGNNMLYSTGDGKNSPSLTAAEMEAKPLNEGNYMFYKLSLNKNHEKVGFYWGVQGGAAFNYNTGHQAFLAVPQTNGEQGAAAYLFDSDATGIYSIKATESESNNATYTLSGIRVENKQLPKGIYIKNGKKVVVR